MLFLILIFLSGCSTLNPFSRHVASLNEGNWAKYDPNLDLQNYQDLFASMNADVPDKLLAMGPANLCRAVSYLDYQNTLHDPNFTGFKQDKGDASWKTSWRYSFEFKLSERIKALTGPGAFLRVFDGDFESAGKYFSRELPNPQMAEIEARIERESAFTPTFTLSLIKNAQNKSSEDLLDRGKAVGICAKEFFFDAISCERALHDIVDLMRESEVKDPQDGEIYYYSLPPLLEKVFLTPQYRLSLSALAKKMLARIQHQDLKDANMWVDVMSAAQEGGASSPEEAESIAMEIMGLWAVGSPVLNINTGNVPEIAAAKMALAIVTASTPILDAMAFGGQVYSIPQNIRTSCDTSKPYHFWMTAYLAYTLAKDPGAPFRGTAAAAFLADKGYQILAKTLSRDPSYIYRQNPFSARANAIRADLSFSAAGALYGGSLGKHQSVNIDVDRVLAAVYKKSEILPPLSLEKSQKLASSKSLELYERFSRMFGGMTAFSAAEKSK